MLSVFFDKVRIIRFRGRFLESNKLHLDLEYKNPTILDPKQKFCLLLLHEDSKYLGVGTVVNNIRQEYWIIHLRSDFYSMFISYSSKV